MNQVGPGCGRNLAADRTRGKSVVVRERKKIQNCIYNIVALGVEQSGRTAGLIYGRPYVSQALVLLEVSWLQKTIIGSFLGNIQG